MHDTKHPWAGKTVTIVSGTFTGQRYRIEDWWDHLTGKSWGDSEGNPAAMEGAVFVGSIAMRFVRDPGRKQRFMELVHDGIKAVFEEQYGPGVFSADNVVPAPEHERTKE